MSYPNVLPFVSVSTQMLITILVNYTLDSGKLEMLIAKTRMVLLGRGNRFIEREYYYAYFCNLVLAHTPPDLTRAA